MLQDLWRAGAPSSVLEITRPAYMLRDAPGVSAMIRYSLKCATDHRFESWFASSSAYDRLHAAGHVTCPECGTSQVEKAMMAPQVAADRAAPPSSPEPAHSTPAPATGADPAPDPRAEAIARLRDHVERNSEYVGLRFAAEARRIHAGEAPERAIFGEARPEDARALIAEGVPVAPLPFIPRRKTN
jgi:hypothetical protein